MKRGFRRNHFKASRSRINGSIQVVIEVTKVSLAQAVCNCSRVTSRVFRMKESDRLFWA